MPQWLHFPEIEVTINPHYIVRVDHWTDQGVDFYRVNYINAAQEEAVITVDNASSPDDYAAIRRFLFGGA